MEDERRNQNAGGRATNRNWKLEMKSRFLQIRWKNKKG